MPQPKRILRNLTLSAIAAVDRPCQEGAKAAIMKRRDDPAQPSQMAQRLAKYIGTDDGAHSYSEVLAENQFDQAVWPMVDALTQSIRSIVGDKGLTSDGRETKIQQTIDQFLADVRSKAGAAAAEKIESDISGLLSKRESDMTELEKAQAKIAELTGQLSSATALAAAEKARADAAEKSAKDMESDRDKAKTEADEAKKALVAATDDVVKVDDVEVRKSVVGEAQFAVTKALIGQRDLAVIEKRVETEFAHVPGSPAEKAQLLKARESMPEPAQKALDVVLGACEKMVAQGFAQLGVTGEQAEQIEKARGDFETKVADIEKRDGIARHQAMQKARQEHPALFEAYREAVDA